MDEDIKRELHLVGWLGNSLFCTNTFVCNEDLQPPYVTDGGVIYISILETTHIH
jgi:hypothetical protein